jgi:hypothetical protein
MMYSLRSVKTDVLGEQPVSEKTDVLAPPDAPPWYLDVFALPHASQPAVALPHSSPRPQLSLRVPDALIFHSLPKQFCYRPHFISHAPRSTFVSGLGRVRHGRPCGRARRRRCQRTRREASSRSYPQLPAEEPDQRAGAAARTHHMAFGPPRRGARPGLLGTTPARPHGSQPGDPIPWATERDLAAPSSMLATPWSALWVPRRRGAWTAAPTSRPRCGGCR